MKSLLKNFIALALMLTLLCPFFIAAYADDLSFEEPTSSSSEEPEVSSPEEPTAPVFPDIAGHWAEEVITKWYNAGILVGYPDGTFRPDEPIHRAELAKVITLAFDLEEVSEISFADVAADSWCYKYLTTAAAYIPTYAPPDKTPETFDYSYYTNYFLPNAMTLRCHMAETFSLLKIKHDGLTVEYPSIQDINAAVKDRFADDEYDNLHATDEGIPETVKRFQTYTWLVSELGIMQGDPDGYFYPYRWLTRAEVLTILDRMLEP